MEEAEDAMAENLPLKMDADEKAKYNSVNGRAFLGEYHDQGTSSQRLPVPEF